MPSRRRRGSKKVEGLSREELEKLVVTLEEEMFVAAEELRFEYAAKLRDEIKDLRRELNAIQEVRSLTMCRSIHTLYNVEPAASKEEARAAALQYVRKISGYRKPSQSERRPRSRRQSTRSPRSRGGSSASSRRQRRRGIASTCTRSGARRPQPGSQRGRGPCVAPPGARRLQPEPKSGCEQMPQEPLASARNSLVSSTCSRLLVARPARMPSSPSW